MNAKNMIALAGGLTLSAACAKSGASDLTGPVAYCTAVAPIALVVTVRDSVSGRALADSASGSFRVSATTDTLLHLDSLTLIGGRDKGTYDVTVQRAGYRTWTRSGISAMKTTTCGGVAPVALAAMLQRLP
ncbi:MAG: hypothetical protein ACHQRL_08515 [Gemmatimonadales bacterium]